ncbi:MAG: hypothetical protein DMF24_03930 [Verrucomicrobia bacterium]|nr:MAG: hypothetical protein DMF24_03930 [Verrucomicrobiota bacterium]
MRRCARQTVLRHQRQKLQIATSNLQRNPNHQISKPRAIGLKLRGFTGAWKLELFAVVERAIASGSQI